MLPPSLLLSQRLGSMPVQSLHHLTVGFFIERVGARKSSVEAKIFSISKMWDCVRIY